ncbi:hypothetical protein [Microbulbifer spongiae]|uniref:Uncharacterized protein n=1 Tax=Microbulbifer spongiae TaxID=2944933 RepID=A0ABY9EDM8_9GAMM|nr:hypothetical protein [Microbulbifer sp. MI-G]WKD51128.1 hypothetical protein M8T91_06835 [Microbulbifer sp. MI-G]
MEINHIFRFEKLRDGGSLIVSFQSKDSCEYWVMFPIAKYDVKDPKFKVPVLVNRATGIEVNLSPSGAMQWLKKLKPFFEQRSELPHVSKELESEILNRMIVLCQENV